MRPGARSLLVINSRMEPGIVGVTVDREQIENERLRHAITGISRVVPVTPTAVNIEQARAKLLTAGLTEGYEESARALASWALEYGIALLVALERVLALHTVFGPVIGGYCRHCNHSWPCETVRAVTDAWERWGCDGP